MENGTKVNPPTVNPPVVNTPIATKVEETTKVTKATDDILAELSATISNLPTTDMLNQWKQNYGEVYYIPFNDDTVFFFKQVSRGEYKTIKHKQTEGIIKNSSDQTNDKEAVAQAQYLEQLSQEIYEDELLITCVLFPDIKDPGKIPAGIASTTVNLIELVSGFLPPNLAISITNKI